MSVSDNTKLHYFIDALTFFNEVQWIYNSAVTEILVRKYLDLFPDGWLETLENLENEELNDFVIHKHFKSNWPKSLILFLEKCKALNILINKISLELSTLPNSFLKGLSPKKQHEILHLAQLVHLQCAKQNISTIIDLGAGLGYVGQLLYHLFGYRVLGLEMSAQNVETAKNRQQKFYPESIDSVKYICHTLTNNSATLIQLLIEETFQNCQNVCLVGLHACGDLGVNMLKIYSSLISAKVLILLSCCYHKLSISINSSTEAMYFDNFPMSEVLKEAVEKTHLDIGIFLRRPFLRLACQESADRWQGMSEYAHGEHSFHVLSRAVLELYAVQNGLYLEKLVKKGTRKSQCLDFQTYLKDSLQRYIFKRILETEENDKFNNGIPNEKEIEENVIALWNENSVKLKSAEMYTALQMLLQSPAESLVLNDRLCWLKEHDFEGTIIPVANRKLSPRCYAIVSWKN